MLIRMGGAMRVLIQIVDILVRDNGRVVVYSHTSL